MNINIKDYILSIDSSFDFGADYVNAFFEDALNLLHENKGGEIYLPNGTYKFNSSIRCTKQQGFDFINVYPDEVIEFILISRISTEYNRIILEITDAGSPNSPAKFRWSKNWGLTWYEENISIPSNGEYMLVGTSINVKFPKLFFRPRPQSGSIAFFWTGDGIYPLPYNSKIRGENINNTILEFDFSETVGQGDAIVAVWNPMRNAHEQVEISDLTIKNLSTTNTHRVVQIPSNNILPSVDLKNSLPYKSNGIIFLRINNVIRNGSIYQLQYEFGEKWKNDIGGNIVESKFAWGLSKNMLIDKEVELTGTGLSIKLNDNYENGQTYEYEWITEGYAGAGILCVGDRDVNIKNVAILDFVRSIIIDISLNTIISGCRLYNSIKPNHHIGIWYATNYLSKFKWNGKIVAPPGGGTNLHMIENCIFAGSAVGIWHEDGINHVVKFCAFDSTNICSLLGSTTNIKYESCYYESIVTSFFEHSRRGSVGNFDVSNCTFDSKSGAKLFNLVTPEGFAIHLLRIDNCYINSINQEGLIKYTEKIRRLYWNSISAYEPLFDIYPNSKDSIFISNGQNRYEIEVQSDTNTVFQNVGFGSSLSEFSPIGFSRTLNKAITIMPTDENVSQSEKEIKMTEMTRNTFLHLESIITATTSDNLCAFWKLRCLIKNINGVNIIVQIKTLDSYRDTGLRYALRPNFNFANQNVVLHLKHPQGLDSICHWSIKNEIVSNSI